MGRTQVKERKRAAAPAEVTSCRHHWIIESPRGTLSKGRCKLCGEERQFRNSTNDYIWDDDSSSSSGYGSWRAVRSTPKLTDDDDMAAGPDSRNGKVPLAL
jgi:hypothetical protein